MNKQHKYKTLLTKDGYKEWHGKRWEYYVKTKCKVCNNELYVYRADYIKQGYGLCSNKKSYCQYAFRQLKSDPIGYNILNNISDNNFYYLVGLITSDGHISWPKCTKTKHSYTCDIGLHIKDKEILHQIKNKFGGSIKYYTNNKTKQQICKWMISSKPFIEYLRDVVGLTNNKSLTLHINDNWFRGLTEAQQYYFWHGVLDGDGCVCLTKNTQRVEICSYSNKFITFMKNYFSKYEHMVTNKHTIMFHGKYIPGAFNNIFEKKDSDIYLKRKYNKFQTIKDIYINEH